MAGSPARRCGAPAPAASASCWSSPPRLRRRSNPTSTGSPCRTAGSAQWSRPTVAIVSESADRSPQSPTPNPQSRPYRIAVLASGRGRNLQALMDAIAEGTLVAENVGGFSDRPDRKSVVYAKLVSVRLIPGGCRTFYKKNNLIILLLIKL